MLNIYEQEFLCKQHESEHSYFIEQLDIHENHPLYAPYYNPNPKNLEERFIIIPTETKANGCHVKLVDVCIRNSFYGCVLNSNSIEILEEEKQKILNNILSIKKRYEQLTLF